MDLKWVSIKSNQTRYEGEIHICGFDNETIKYYIIDDGVIEYGNLPRISSSIPKNVYLDCMIQTLACFSDLDSIRYSSLTKEDTELNPYVVFQSLLSNEITIELLSYPPSSFQNFKTSNNEMFRLLAKYLSERV